MAHGIMGACPLKKHLLALAFPSSLGGGEPRMAHDIMGACPLKKHLPALAFPSSLGGGVGVVGHISSQPFYSPNVSFFQHIPIVTILPKHIHTNIQTPVCRNSQTTKLHTLMYRDKSNIKPLKIYRKALRNHSTAAEAILWRCLKHSQVGGLKFRRQHSIGNYIMDFYCPSLKLAIELDGNIHNDRAVHEYDEARTRFLEENGITVIRFDNEHVYHYSGHIIETILTFQQHKTEKP